MKLRVIVAREPDFPHPTVVGAISEDTWEIIPPEEWDKIKRDLAAKWLGPDWTAYDFAEAILDVPDEPLHALFGPTIKVESVEAASDA